MKIVKFNDGTFGIRKWFFGWSFYDFKPAFYKWRTKDSEYFRDCKTTLLHCRQTLHEINNPDYGTIICNCK